MIMMNLSGAKAIFLTILISGFSLASSELLRPPQPPQYNYAFNKFRPPPPPEPTFIQRITNWFFPWGGVISEEDIQIPAAPKIDFQPQHHHQQPPHQQHAQNHPISRTNPVQVRDTEPTTSRTTQSPPVTKCSPCNKEPWIPMMPTYQLPIVKPSGQQHVSFKHHFGDDAQYAHVPASGGYKYPPQTSSQPPSTTPIKFQDGSNFIQGYQSYGVPPSSSGGYSYQQPTSSQPPLSTPLKFQEGSNFIQGHQNYGVPPIQNVQFQGYHYAAQAPQYPTQAPQHPRSTTFRPNTNTIDTSVITFTTGRPQNNRPLRYTAAGSVTNPEYILPPNVLPLEGENGNFAPIPIPNLSPSPIPPLFDAKPFHDNPYRSQTGFIKLVPLEPNAQLSSNVNVQVKPEKSLNFQRFEAVKGNQAVEVISSNLVAEFTLPPENFRNDYLTRQTVPLHENFGNLNLDFGNKLDANTTINSPIVVDSLETVTDTIGAGSEDNYEHNIHQALEAPFQQPLSSDDDAIDTEESNRVLPLRFSKFESQESDSEEQTTTEESYVVQFEPSLQTAADLAERETKKEDDEKLKKNRDRLTPIELLDSPIFHVAPFTVKPKTTTLTETPPKFKPVEDFTKKLATLWTSPIPISTSIEPITTAVQTTVRTTTAQATLPPVQSTTLSFSSTVSGGTSSLKITPHRESPKPAPSTKKPKQIQIVIPYTTFHKPSPFKIQEEQDLVTYRPIRGHYVTHASRTTGLPEVKNLKLEETFNGHGYHNDQEYHDHAQESKIVESTVTIEPPRTTKYLTKILANNIRELLKKEKTPKLPRIDLIRLQKNIDGWTEQSFKGKASTISQTGHTKSIPKSFLSTTMKVTTFTKTQTTVSPRTTFDPALMEETKRQYDNILYKNDDNLLYVKRHDRFLDRDNELVLLNNNLTFYSVHEGVNVFAPKTTLTPKELWKRLHLTVSPLTNEKIHVVTPQPHQKTEAEKVSTFRPRFSVRPTVAGRKQAKQMKPEIKNRMDDTEMTVETVDKVAKVVKIITPEQDGITSSMEVIPE